MPTPANNCKTHLAYLTSQCSEFEAEYIIDEKNCSVILNVDGQFFEDVNTFFTAYGFTCVHMSELNETATCCFLLKEA